MKYFFLEGHYFLDIQYSSIPQWDLFKTIKEENHISNSINQTGNPAILFTLVSDPGVGEQDTDPAIILKKIKADPDLKIKNIIDEKSEY